MACLETAGMVTCAAVSTVSVGVCGIANLKSRLNKKPYDTRDLTIENKYKVNKIAKSVRCFKNGQELGTGQALFDGEVLELPFLREGLNMVAVSGMAVRAEGNLVQLTPKDSPITEFKMEFPEQSEAVAWSHYFQDAVNDITASYHTRVADLRNKIKMQERVIASLHDQAGYGEEGAPIVDGHHRAIIHKVNAHRDEMLDHATKLHTKLAELEANVHPTRNVYETHATRLEEKLRELETNRETGNVEHITQYKEENSALSKKVEEMAANKVELTRMTNSLSQRLEALERGRPGAGNNTALYSQVMSLQSKKDQVTSHANSLMEKLEILESHVKMDAAAQGRQPPPLVDPAMVARMQELEAQLQGWSSEREALVAKHQAQLGAKDRDLALHIDTINQHSQRLQMYQEQTPQLHAQVAEYEQQVNEQKRHMEMLEKQAQDARTAAATPAFDTQALEAERAEKAAAHARADAAEAKLMTFELEFQKAMNHANDHQLRAEQEAANAQAEAQRAQDLHQQKEGLLNQLEEAKAIAEQHAARAAQLQDSHSSSAVHVQQLAAFESQKEQDQLAIRNLEYAVQAKDAEFEQMVAQVQQSKDKEINELVLTLQSKDQEVEQLAGEVQALKEACGSIPQLESDRDQLIMTIEQEREAVGRLEAHLRRLEQEAPTVSYEQECLTLQGQLRGSQQELFAAQAKIVELESRMEAQLAIAASLPVSPGEPTSPMSQVGQVVETAPVYQFETAAAPPGPAYQFETAPPQYQFETAPPAAPYPIETATAPISIPTITPTVETISSPNLVTQQPTSASRYVEITQPPGSPSKGSYNTATPYTFPTQAPTAVQTAAYSTGSYGGRSQSTALPVPAVGLQKSGTQVAAYATEIDKVDQYGRVVERDFIISGPAASPQYSTGRQLAGSAGLMGPPYAPTLAAANVQASPGLLGRAVQPTYSGTYSTGGVYGTARRTG